MTEVNDVELKKLSWKPESCSILWLSRSYGSKNTKKACVTPSSVNAFHPASCSTKPAAAKSIPPPLCINAAVVLVVFNVAVTILEHLAVLEKALLRLTARLML